MILMLKKLPALLLMYFLFPGLLCTRSMAQNEPNFSMVQKKRIQNDSYKSWESLDKGTYSISDDGKFIFYNYASQAKGNVLVIQGTETSFKQSFSRVNARSAIFSPDSKYLFFNLEKDTLAIFNLSSKHITYKLNTQILEFVTLKSGHIVLIGRGKGSTLQVVELEDLKERTITGVDHYRLNKKSSIVAIVSKDSIGVFDLSEFRYSFIADKSKFYPVSFDDTGNKLLFYSKSPLKRIFIYSVITKKLNLILSENSLDIPDGYMIGDEMPSFTPGGKDLVFKFVRKKVEEPLINMAEIWDNNSFLDRQLDNHAIGTVKTDIDQPKVSNLINGKVEIIGELSREYLVIQRNFINKDHVYWRKDLSPNRRLYSIDGGSAIDFIPSEHQVSSTGIQRSPGGRFVGWYDLISGDYFCYDIKTRTLNNTTSRIILPNDVIRMVGGSIPQKLTQLEITWLVDEKSFLIFDKYDLWQVDPLGISSPINLTKGYGRLNNIEYQFGISDIEKKSLYNNQTIILCALDLTNMNNGFWTIRLGSPKSLKKLSMENALFFWPMIMAEASNTVPQKAKNVSKYLVMRQTAATSPNLYISKDLKSFKKITYCEPEEEYNWVRSELITYPIEKNRLGKGILYKPEDFDSTKTYPMIVNYYQERSFELNLFRRPAPIATNIDVAWFVSNGYLVFMPDIINDRPGKIGETVVKTVESGIDYISQYKWLNKNKIGAQGQSFGGFETNLLIAYSNKITAAQSMSAPSDAIGGYFGICFDAAAFTAYEQGQFNFGQTIWENPKPYLENSPALLADKINTPLLILHCQEDGAVPFHQGRALFFALQRLNKPVWLVNYQIDKTEHFVVHEESAFDFTIKVEEFFDYFLKNKEKPVWMGGKTINAN